MPVCPFPSPGWPQGFWTSLSASHVQVLLPHQCPGEGGDGAGAGAKLVMGLRCGCESPPCPEPCHAQGLAVSREELCASPLPTPALGAHPWALPGAPPGRTGPGSGESPCWNGATGQKLLEKGYWGQPHVWEHRHTNLYETEPIFGAHVPKIFVKWKTYQLCGIKYFLFYAFAPRFSC